MEIVKAFTNLKIAQTQEGSREDVIMLGNEHLELEEENWENVLKEAMAEVKKRASPPRIVIACLNNDVDDDDPTSLIRNIKLYQLKEEELTSVKFIFSQPEESSAAIATTRSINEKAWDDRVEILQ
jgi:NAD+--asparagine ADP-ribosyltransferase